MTDLVKYIEYKSEHAGNIVEQGAIGLCDATAEDIAKASMDKLNGPAFTVLFNGRIVASCGVETMWTGVAQAWALCVQDIGSIRMDPKNNREKFYEIVKDAGLWRVQAPLKSDFPAGVSFARYMGFELESVMKKYHADGTDALMYVLGDI